jgi:hypothetical protein
MQVSASSNVQRLTSIERLISVSITCTTCGEELLGAVNRCWNCGSEFPLHQGSVNLPPVRRAPIETPLAEAATGAVPAGMEADGNERSPRDVAIPDEPVLATTSGASDAGAVHHPPAATPLHPVGAAGWAAVVSLLCGVVAIGTLWFSFLAIIPSLLGVALGSWGLNSRRRGVATCGLVLCIVALAIAGFIILVEVYAYFTGSHPFLQPPEVLPDDPNDLLDGF